MERSRGSDPIPKLRFDDERAPLLSHSHTIALLPSRILDVNVLKVKQILIFIVWFFFPPPSGDC